MTHEGWVFKSLRLKFVDEDLRLNLNYDMEYQEHQKGIPIATPKSFATEGTTPLQVS
jgi:hypothetical protein